MFNWSQNYALLFLLHDIMFFIKNRSKTYLWQNTSYSISLKIQIIWKTSISTHSIWWKLFISECNRIQLGAFTRQCLQFGMSSTESVFKKIYSSTKTEGNNDINTLVVSFHKKACSIGSFLGYFRNISWYCDTSTPTSQDLGKILDKTVAHAGCLIAKSMLWFICNRELRTSVISLLAVECLKWFLVP